MTPMAFLFAALFAVVILLPVAAVWIANRVGLFAEPIGKPRIIQFPEVTAHAHRRHKDAA